MNRSLWTLINHIEATKHYHYKEKYEKSGKEVHEN